VALSYKGADKSLDRPGVHNLMFLSEWLEFPYQLLSGTGF